MQLKLYSLLKSRYRYIDVLDSFSELLIILCFIGLYYKLPNKTYKKDTSIVPCSQGGCFLNTPILRAIWGWLSQAKVKSLIRQLLSLVLFYVLPVPMAFF